MDFSAASTATIVARLACMADDRQFRLESAETFLRFTPKVYPCAQSIAPRTGEPAYMVGYCLLYRRHVFRGLLVCGLAYMGIAEAILANDALFQVEHYDQQHPRTEYSISEVGGP
jgi:hypothetical protein